MPDQSLNQQIADRITAHAVDLERVKAGLRNQAIKQLKQLEGDLVAEIAKIDPSAPTQSAYKQARLNALLKQTRATLKTHYKKMSAAHGDALQELSSIESGFAQDLVNRPLGVELASVAVSPEQLEAIVSNLVIDGALVKDWWAKQEGDTAFRFANAMKQGMLRGETLQELINRVRGTKANNYSDGIMNLSKAQAESLVRTSAQKVANEARRASYMANSDVVKGVQQVSTLDKRTTPVCIARSNKVWLFPDMEPEGHSLPWNGGTPLHWQCRSTENPVTRSWQELGARKKPLQTGGRPSFDPEAYFKKRLKDRGFTDDQIKGHIRNAQASMDGYVPEAWDYEDWLKRKPEEDQIEVLGKGKWDLWKAGKIGFEDLVDESGRPMSLAELKAKAAGKEEAAKKQKLSQAAQKGVSTKKAKKKAEELALQASQQNLLAVEQRLASVDIADARAKAQAALEEALEQQQKIPANEALFDIQEFENIGPQRGSNPGGLFRHKETGQQWYIKFPPSEAHARNEALAAAFYDRLGIEAPQIKLIRRNNQIGVASKIIEGLESDAARLKAGKIEGVFEGFAADAWLSNWDVVGLQFDNMLLKGKKAVRVDTGGALLYRAQGAPKGVAFGKIVTEWDSFRNSTFTTGQVFQNITDKQLIDSAARVLKLKDQDIRDLVRRHGFGDDLAETLIARKKWIRREVNELKKKAKATVTPVPPAPVDGVTREEWALIEEARSNGYAVAVDKEDIEDQQILFWKEAGARGEVLVGSNLKLRGESRKALEGWVRKSDPHVSLEVDSETETFHGLLLQNIKGVKSRINQGKIDVFDWEVHVKERYQTLKHTYASLPAPVRDYYREWMTALDAIFEHESTPAQWAGPNGLLQKYIPPPAAAEPGLAFRFKRKEGRLEAKVLDRGFMRQTGDAVRFDGAEQFRYYYETALPDGTIVRYWPDRSDEAFAWRSQLQVFVKDNGPASPNQILDVLKKMGVETGKPSLLDAEELYLTQIAYLRRRKFAEFSALKQSVPDPAERVQKMRDWLSQEIGVPDIAQLPDYNPAGKHEQFGHGYIRRLRPDLPDSDPEWKAFKAKYRIIHNNTVGTMVETIDKILNSGGKMIPTTDKLRRGLGWAGMSPEQDMNTGGANYFFTRIRKKEIREPGFYWKADALKRLDAISYHSDYFGDTGGGHHGKDVVLRDRKSTVEEWKEIAGNPRNETIFKNGLSLFEHLEKIVVRRSEVAEVKRIFQQHGYNVWPDGRSLDEVIVGL